MKNTRWEKLWVSLKDQEIDGIILVPGPNFYYLSGLRMGLSERATLLFIFKDKKASLVMPQLEASKGYKVTKDLEDEGVEVELTVYPYSDEEGPENAVAKAMGQFGSNALEWGSPTSDIPAKGGLWALDYRSVRLLEFSLVKKVLGDFRYVDAGTILNRLRIIKDKEEISLMEKAARLCDLGVDVARRALLPGVNGVQVSRKVEEALKDRGAQGVGISLAIGPDTAIPHFGTSERQANEEDLAWIDLVVSVGGYWADITRTFVIGAISPELERIYRLVLEAQENARLKARAGMTGAEIDALARDVIAGRGYGEYFIHRTGHGLGLEVHEEPYVVASNQKPIEEGSVVTIEPGIYLPGKGGVRIEDDIVLTDEGPRSLTSYPRNLLDPNGKMVV